MTSQLLQHALNYAQLGWKVFPVRIDKTPYTTHGFKDATIDPDLIQQYWIQHPTAGIGVATGKESGIVVLDIDLKKNSTETSLNALVQKHGGFPQAVACHTGGGGVHFYFRHPGGEQIVRNARSFDSLPGIDIRGDGGYVVAPPSPHASGTPYEWGEGQSPLEIPLAKCPAFLYEARKGPSLSTFTDAPIPEGERDATLTQLAGKLRSMAFDERLILMVLHEVNELRCLPPLPDAQIEKIAQHIVQYPPHRNHGDEDTELTRDLLGFEQTDTGFGLMLAHALRGTASFNHDTNKWFLWRTHFWEPDVQNEIMLHVIDIAKQYKNALKLITNEDALTKAQKFAHSIQNQLRMIAGTKIAASQLDVATTQSKWDRDPDLFAVQNGVMDLKTGSFRVGVPFDYISKHSNVAYDPDATCPKWLQTLDEIFQGDQEVIDFMQRAMGYTLTGQISEQCIFVLVGQGANGKSTILDIMSTLWNDYSYTAPFSTFERQRGGMRTQSNDLAALVGQRFVTSSEPNISAMLDEARIKSLTGGEQVSARFLYSEHFTFKPVSKIWLGVNHPPRIADSSDGFWRRMRRVNFEVQFVEDPVKEHELAMNPQLSIELLNEISGILNWVLEGARAWYVHGLQVPEQVADANDEYRKDSDPITTFLEDMCIEEDDAFVPEDLLYQKYSAYCRLHRVKPYEVYGTQKFRSRIASQFKRESQGPLRVYRGLKLKPPAARVGSPERAVTIITSNRAG